MKRIIFLLLIIFFFSNILAQVEIPSAKIGATLKMLLDGDSLNASRFIRTQRDEKMVSVIIETNQPNQKTLLKEMGYNIRTTIGTVSTADVPLNNIQKLSSLSFIRRIELPLLLQKTDTVMKQFTTVANVLDGNYPLNRPYTGNDIVIGIIDDGLDISHPCFYGENGKIRISHLWNMDYSQSLFSDNIPYGKEWTSDSMEYYADRFKKSLVGKYAMQSMFGFSFHGTSVASLAAGNNGVAPGAEIVGVALTAFADTLLRSDRIIDGIAYIYSVAKKQKKKCVINISLGTIHGGPHDGKTLLEKVIDFFSLLHPDLLVCVSAGNNGNDWKHWGGFPVHPDSSFGFFQCSYKASLYFSIPRNDSKNLNISIGESKLGNLSYPNIAKDSVYYQSPFLNIDSLIRKSKPVVFESLLSNGRTSSFITFSAARYNDDYDELIITTDEHTSNGSTSFDPHLYRFIFKGQGTVHGWFPFLNLHPVFLNKNPYPNDPTYQGTDNNYTTGIPSNAFTVLSSGAYNIRTCYVNKKDKVVNQYEKCRTTYFTSHGPTLDGRIKPDVISPGENVFAALSHFQDFTDYEFILDDNTVSFGGTSASSPITAGIAALIWEKYPDLPRDSVIGLIKSSANFDTYSAMWGGRPNNIAGWGKTDAFFALTGVRIDNSSNCKIGDVCISKYEPPVIIPPVAPAENVFRIFPNPIENFAWIYYASEKPIKFRVFDVMGRVIQNTSLAASSGSQVSLDTKKFSAGIYFIKVVGLEKPTVLKIVVQ